MVIIFLKVLVSKVFVIKIQASDTISKLKKLILKEIIWSQRSLWKSPWTEKDIKLFFQGREVVEGRSLEHNDIGYGSMLFSIITNQFVNPSIPEFCHFQVLRSSMKNTNEKSISGVFSCFERRILSSGGIYGPLSIILSFIDPLNLLTIGCVSKGFYYTIWKMIDERKIIFTKYHLYLMLCIPECHINEILFNKLLTRCPWYFEKEFIDPSLSSQTLLKVCVKNNFLSSLKRVVEELELSKIENIEILESYLRRGERANKEIVYYLIDNLSALKGRSSWSDSIFTNLFEYFAKDEKSTNELWGRIVKILSLKGKDMYQNENKMICFLQSYSKSIASGNRFLGTLEKFLSIEKYIGPIVFLNDGGSFRTISIKRKLSSAFKNMEWKLIKYLISHPPVSTEEGRPNLDRSSYFEVTQELSELEEFISCVLLEEEDISGIQIYRPRFLLQHAYLNGDLKEVNRLIHERVYDYISDPHRNTLQFPFSKITDPSMREKVRCFFGGEVQRARTMSRFPQQEQQQTPASGRRIHLVEYLESVFFQEDQVRSDELLRHWKSFICERYNEPLKFLYILEANIHQERFDLVSSLLQLHEDSIDMVVTNGLFDLLLCVIRKKGPDQLREEIIKMMMKKCEFRKLFQFFFNFVGEEPEKEALEKYSLYLVENDDRGERDEEELGRIFQKLVELELIDHLEVLLNKPYWKNRIGSLSIREDREGTVRMLGRAGLGEFRVGCAASTSLRESGMLVGQSGVEGVEGLGKCGKFFDVMEEGNEVYFLPIGAEPKKFDKGEKDDFEEEDFEEEGIMTFSDEFVFVSIVLDILKGKILCKNCYEVIEKLIII